MPAVAEALTCPHCLAPVGAADWNREPAACWACRAPLSVQVFPQFFATAESSSAGDPILEAGEASCFFHADKQAVVPCDQCGRFLCSLCRVEFLGQNWCPGCIQQRKERGGLADLDASRPLYDNMALMLAAAPALLIWPTILSAPMALFLTVRYWRAPSSILPRTKVRFVLAAILSLLEITAWIWLVAYLIFR